MDTKARAATATATFHERRPLARTHTHTLQYRKERKIVTYVFLVFATVRDLVRDAVQIRIRLLQEKLRCAQRHLLEKSAQSNLQARMETTERHTSAFSRVPVRMFSRVSG
jgi:hypothetical protein